VIAANGAEAVALDRKSTPELHNSDSTSFLTADKTTIGVMPPQRCT
jgi:hypothetical protein